MYFAPKEITLKDGRIALLRSPLPSDAEAALEYLKITAGETPYLLRTPEEIRLTVADEEKFLSRFPDNPNSTMILCFVEGKLAGNCQIDRRTKLKNRHRASVAIALQKEFWNLGIGTALFEEMISIAESWGVLQVELEVIEGNDRAMALYRKMGFETVSFVPNAIRMPDGSFVREFLMVKPLKK
ncbi:MAG: GNAT family N-acetyltransferase [Ruminococcaceae bacterium]|nr:GNAT family N-acetyltransferase [Oscillospiraceae bacterium]